ncbi:phosphatase PAP2 family protein [Leyella stercorea]|jgi:undecaprenyl-diphosphatase|uniref:PAP2 family protein n=1 Tax=Leyella stercorea CAG:629 TaxID=1263103 RepID=R7H1F0_9BACT|nr:phosphatase PAP2 family protein [Leyella stercorea]MBD8936899.1 phosphatase PAP2 family protein [Leyella stercorea]MBD8938013.1 phosphatase PAP2 family protein [Leyella stercorea]MBL6517631.1 phosphatase PAP2 family protein [Leyella stercorea]CDE33499.1 pAP2 family protein [Leyella stercorea CAG:629]
MWFNFFKEFILWLSDIDARLLLIVNGAHSPFFDSVMWCISGRWIWVPFYAVLAYLLFRRMSWKRASICLVTIGLIILAADQTCATLIRPEIGRLRPANLNNPLSSFVHVVNGYRGGRYGFPSCHAANTFALAVFMSLVIRHKWFTVMMFSWAFVVSYSRMYLGVHYFGDLFCGATIGSLFAVLFYYLQNYLFKRLNI